MRERTTSSNDDKTITINSKAFEPLTRAKKEGENYSDVIIRLISTTLKCLQRRGEMGAVTSDNRRLSIRIEKDRRLGAMSCAAEAPELFALDTSRLGVGRSGDEPPGMRDVPEGEIDSESLLRAAQSFPTKRYG